MSMCLGHPLFVLGCGFFSSAHGGPGALLRGEDGGQHKPAFKLLEGRARRFTSLVMQMHVEVCEQALGGHSAELPCASVFCSNYGEVQTAADLIADIRTHQTVSSARFALSVHNAPSGVYSIAARNHAPTTTLTAGAHSLAAGLLEASLTAQETTERPVLVSFADEPLPAVFGGIEGAFGAAAAWLIGAQKVDGGPLLGTLRLAERATPGGVELEARRRNSCGGGAGPGHRDEAARESGGRWAAAGLRAVGGVFPDGGRARVVTTEPLTIRRAAMERYLPQRGAMVLLDSVLENLPLEVVCQATIDEGCVFAQSGCVEAAALLEFAAQAAAVYVSLHAKTPVIGFLASCREAHFMVPAVDVGSVLQIRARRVSGDHASGAFECQVMRGHEVCARMHLLLVDPGWGAL